jgi:SAM domain (Sterile alpha motif)
LSPPAAHSPPSPALPCSFLSAVSSVRLRTLLPVLQSLHASSLQRFDVYTVCAVLRKFFVQLPDAVLPFPPAIAGIEIGLRSTKKEGLSAGSLRASFNSLSTTQQTICELAIKLLHILCESCTDQRTHSRPAPLTQFLRFVGVFLFLAHRYANSFPLSLVCCCALLFLLLSSSSSPLLFQHVGAIDLLCLSFAAFLVEAPDFTSACGVDTANQIVSGFVKHYDEVFSEDGATSRPAASSTSSSSASSSSRSSRKKKSSSSKSGSTRSRKKGVTAPEGKPAEWDQVSVVQWLHAVWCADAVSAFESANVNGTVLLQLSDSKLLGMGVSSSRLRQQIVDHIASLTR